MKKVRVNIFILCTFLASGMGCKSSVDTCIDPAKVNEEAICTMDYTPVCGCDNTTYSNACGAENSGVTSWTEGACPE